MSQEKHIFPYAIVISKRGGTAKDALAEMVDQDPILGSRRPGIIEETS